MCLALVVLDPACLIDIKGQFPPKCTLLQLRYLKCTSNSWKYKQRIYQWKASDINLQIQSWSNSVVGQTKSMLCMNMSEWV